ncbi:MAG: DUF1080 domain-containing protein [Thermoguttaceae bacterium]|nr:DUF1080 domain-containing protein [Thermoguttaceae bacterium]MDW8037362.1 DUF1080 domain-containing protein [Thermoguttaceae bacterium]
MKRLGTLGWWGAILLSLLLGIWLIHRGQQAVPSEPIQIAYSTGKPCCPAAASTAADTALAPTEPAGEKPPSAPEKEESVPEKPAAEKKEAQSNWRPLFNGKDLEGWTPKIRGYPLGENYGNTFRVENGVLKVVYDPKYYPKYEDRFGHLFYKEKFSHYRLRVEYRFTGEQCPGAPKWALRNSGIMIHCQDPKTMTLEQGFPVSIEVQLLGGLGQGERPTANLCTPGTHVVMEGKLFTPHCTNSRSKTYHGDQWVTVEVEVHGAGTIRHYVEGQLVLEYEKPQLDEADPFAKKLLAAGADRLLREGYISLQSESHPIEFRKVEIMLLEQAPQK